MSRKGHGGFVIKNGTDIQVALFDDDKLLETDDGVRLENIDDYLLNFKDENDFRHFLSKSIGIKNVDNADVFIFSNGQSGYRFSDLIFDKGKTFKREVKKVVNKEKPNFYVELNNAYLNYKYKKNYRALFNSSFNKSYPEFKELLKQRIDDKKETFRKNSWLNYQPSCYTNFRNLVFLRGVYRDCFNADSDTLSAICQARDAQIYNREVSRDKITKTIDFAIQKKEAPLWQLLQDDSVYYIKPSGHLALYNELKQRELNKQRELQLMNSQEEVLIKKEEKTEIDPSILGGHSNKENSKRILHARKWEMMDILMSERLFPRDSIECDDNNKYYINLDKLVPQVDEVTREMLNNKLTSRLLKKIYIAKTSKMVLERERKKGGNTLQLKEDYDAAYDTLKNHFNTLIDSPNNKSFQKVYEFCKLLNSVNNKDIDNKGNTNNNGRTR